MLVALAATLPLWLLRAVLDPVLGAEMPYTIFLGVLASSVIGGWKAGLTATALSALAANFSFVAGSAGFLLEGSRGWGFLIFALVASMLVFLVHSLSASLRRERELNEDMTRVSSEYRHRIKNLLAVTQSLLHQTARVSTSVPELRDNAIDRLHALGRAQDLLHLGKAQATPLDKLIDEILAPYDAKRRLLAPLSGPEVLVPAESTIAVALLLNELATNATKYGALSTEKGRLELAWSVRDDWTSIHWKECDGPPVAQPTKLGFGSRLMQSALRASGDVDLAFERDGLRCEIRLHTSPPSVTTGPIGDSSRSAALKRQPLSTE